MTTPQDGKRALFETPVVAPPDIFESGKQRDGKTALYSQHAGRGGVVTLDCQRCGARSRISYTELLRRLAKFSFWVPLRKHSRYFTCPVCQKRSWINVKELPF